MMLLTGQIQLARQIQFQNRQVTLGLVPDYASLALSHVQFPALCVSQVTRDLIRAGQLIKIDVLDHVIIGLC